ncbi:MULTISPECIES: endonuclease [Streptomyces]|uniref:endonuclease n=1 Tax=Streptomyces TaxID=1883 RepID=UPI000995F933|nr:MULTISPECIES: endonuclease [Streptomyces]AQW48847.1 endonuclease [Streptomyces hygroscopicus]ASQ98248.1 endonuclease [Streptomyces sp. 11-1-2]
MGDKHESVARTLLDQQGTTFATQAGIKLRDTPGPLYQLLVLAHLLSARISSDIAVAAARALFDAGMRDPRRMAEATWQQRVDALGEGGYRRYDERTATQLGEAAELVNREYGGDLRRMREAGDPKRLLPEIKGIGPAGVNIFLREVQGVWPEFAPYFDRKALEGAERVGLPESAGALGRLVAEKDLPRLAAALVRVALHADAAREVRAAA